MSWFRIVKHCVLLFLLYLIRDSEYLWHILLSAFAISFTIHFWFRYKTRGWTRSYGPWKHDQSIKSLNYQSEKDFVQNRANCLREKSKIISKFRKV
ncbi:hypothetical protein LEP1GSC062_0120 [Leptospira alexanderi serovar Manhao 3 str. L 60]|uniref:Uncharacterized protein n=1 Tax=Leptospira alexanderi serovar Manhao 3 str. L 60 TaxID=1049759 RepID=V6I781_9LEPT|nr:hypothetical protein LEP1GSC062_0120 [Leptospira alexanderi serovar Manhao 3 str. L 60]